AAAPLAAATTANAALAVSRRNRIDRDALRTCRQSDAPRKSDPINGSLQRAGTDGQRHTWYSPQRFLRRARWSQDSLADRLRDLGTIAAIAPSASNAALPRAGRGSDTAARSDEAAPAPTSSRRGAVSLDAPSVHPAYQPGHRRKIKERPQPG